ncbi:MAG: hypothetical protein WCO98_12180, partial [bacterium]
IFYITMMLMVCSIICAETKKESEPKKVITNSTQAIARAKNFFHNVGWLWSGNVKVKPPEENVVQPNVWGVKDENSTVYCNEFTGNVTIAHTSGMISEGKKDFTKITKETAISFAKKHLKAAGISFDDLVLETIKIEPKLNSSVWQIKYRREYKIYKYLDEWLAISIDPLDGALISFNYHCNSLVPVNTDVKLKKETAIKNAGVCLKNIKQIPGKLVSAELMIVQPDNYLDIAGKKIKSDEYKQQQITRLAWVINLDGPWDITQVWVDAEDGSILGGVHCK